MTAGSVVSVAMETHGSARELRTQTGIVHLLLPFVKLGCNRPVEIVGCVHIWETSISAHPRRHPAFPEPGRANSYRLLEFWGLAVPESRTTHNGRHPAFPETDKTADMLLQSGMRGGRKTEKFDFGPFFGGWP